MDTLNDLTSEAHRFASKARRAFLDGHPVTSKTLLFELYHYLSKKGFAELHAKCVSDESSNGS